MPDDRTKTEVAVATIKADISYIKADIVEIKQEIKGLKSCFVTKDEFGPYKIALTIIGTALLGYFANALIKLIIN